MYKMIVNGIQIGNYKSLKEVAMESARVCSNIRKGINLIRWEKNTLKIRTFD